MTAHIAKHLAVTAGCLCVVAALGLGTYAQAATSPGKDSDAPAIEWTPELDCTATCHGAQAEAMANEDTQGAAAHGSFACVSCHTDEEGLVEGHAKVTADDTKSPKRLKKSEVGSDGCLTCHQVTDGVVPAEAWEAQEAGAAEKPAGSDASKAAESATESKIAEVPAAAGTALAIPAYSSSATAGIEYLTDANGTTVNPHDLPVNKSHATLTCATCHTMHDDATLEATAVKACIKCHHDNVYECFTCHD